ncbi:MAG: Asp23/Gls24 family envelope stress response protein [Peptococcaceae bacterium]|nr:Asp23/Gls24 family envelope stress response protein [Peptococcaceae bacterium]
MGKEISNSLGKIDISEEVIATIAGIAAVECYGLVGMASRKIADGFVELLGKEALSKGIQVKIEDGQVVVDLYIAVIYGVKISEVAHNVMDKVKFTVESMTGLPVAAVNVNVQSVKIAK